jgi:hypothetical protein
MSPPLSAELDDHGPEMRALQSTILPLERLTAEFLMENEKLRAERNHCNSRVRDCQRGGC